MSAKRWWIVSVAVAGLLGFDGTATAQMSLYNQSPASGVSGYARTELGNIYRSSIGTNFTTSQIINNNFYQSQATVPNVGQSVGVGTALNAGPAVGLGSKPFSNVTSDPVVSPWMNMFREDLSGTGDLNYQTLVRPQLNQERINRQVERQNMELGQRVQAMSARNAYNPEGSQQMYPTGHPTTFMNYGHYYPVSRRHR